ncbi:MAG: serine hydrolase [Oscillospiraceae bacterium]|nr:serine hydrolase [Oscillospiraceae bacterium]
MRRIKNLLCLALALCMLLPGLPAAFGEEPDEALPEDSFGIEFPEDERFDGKTWEQVVEEFLQSWGADPDSVGLGYYNTVTGEEQYWNGDKYMVSGSMYKVPLNMAYAAKVASGEMDWDTTIGAFSYERLLEGSIVHSDNEFAKILWDHLGNGRYRTYRRVIAPLMGEDPDTVDAKYYENNFFTPRQMIFCLRELYENQENYPRIIETMQRAEPTEYFKRRERRFNIAHKYGFLQETYHLYMNDCAVAFTDDPIVFVMFTDNTVHAYDVMADFCTLMCDYAQYHHALRLAREAVEAERQRLEEERLEQERLEQERLEQERLAQEQQAQTVPETSQSAAPAQTPSVSESQAPREEDRSPETPEEPQKKGLSLTSFAAIGAAVLAMALALAALSAIAKRFRVRRGFFLVLAVLLSLGALARIAWPAFETARDKPKGDPQETVINFLGALSRGDYAEAYARMDYVETLGLDYQPQRESQKQLFDAMRRTFSAELYGDCTVNGDRAYQQVSCRYLDVDKLNTEAKGQALIYISRYVSSHSVGDLYNESGNYRPELMWEAWDHAMLELLQHPDDYRSSAGVQLELRWHDGAWHVVPNDKLLQLLTGGIDVTEEGAA